MIIPLKVINDITYSPAYYTLLCPDIGPLIKFKNACTYLSDSAVSRTKFIRCEFLPCYSPLNITAGTTLTASLTGKYADKTDTKTPTAIAQIGTPGCTGMNFPNAV